MVAYVIAFDAGDPIHPFSFRLNDSRRFVLPPRVRRRVRAEAGLQWVCRKILFCCAANVASVHVAAGGRRLSG
jgi:hypothetical protein